MKSPIGEALPDLSQALVDDGVKAVASEALEVNQRTMVACHESRRISFAKGVEATPAVALHTGPAPLHAVGRRGHRLSPGGHGVHPAQEQRQLFP